jgi:GNAT superfamily N-acetyltransferase
MILRDAGRPDLGVLYDVWYATETVGMPDPPSPRTMPWFSHLLDVGRLVLAEDGDEVVGFAGVVDLGSCVALSDLFVRPDRQSQGIGAALLDEVLPSDRSLVTMSSADPRAVASYARRGMRPRWPAYYLATAAASVRDRGWPTLDVHDLPFDEYPWPLSGDVRYHRDLGARPVGVARGGRRVGTALIVDASPQRLLHPDATEVLETTVEDADAAAAVVLAVVRHLLDRGATWLVVQVPGPHGALAPLLDRGFTITDIDMACASEEGLLADPARHTMHGEARVTGPPAAQAPSATRG